MGFFISFLVFAFGLCIGSFLNVVIFRLHAKKTFGGRSQCQECGHQLAWFDLVPVVSFLILGGQCRYCHKHISIQYPLVELSTGLAFTFIYYNTDSLRSMIFFWYIACTFIVIFTYDIHHFLIPDIILFPAIIITALYHVTIHYTQFISYGIAAGGACGFFLLLYMLSQGRWIGFGDVKLVILLGLLLGWPVIIVGLFIGFWIGAVWGTTMMIVAKKNLKSQLPFAPSLICGTCVALVWGPALVQWYMGFLS